MAAKMSPPLNGIFLHEENDTLVSSPVNIEPCLYDDLNSPADQICGAEVQRYDPSNSNEFQTILDNKTCAQTEAEPQSTKVRNIENKSLLYICVLLLYLQLS